jgi:hypothetical protein
MVILDVTYFCQSIYIYIISASHGGRKESHNRRLNHSRHVLAVSGMFWDLPKLTKYRLFLV